MKLLTKTLSEIEGDNSLEVVGSIWAPLIEIVDDNDIKKAVTEKGGNVAKAIRVATTKHANTVYEMLAALTVDEETGKPVTVKQYKENCNAIMIMNQLTKLLTDPAVLSLFTSQGQEDETTSGSATETTEESDQ